MPVWWCHMWLLLPLWFTLFQQGCSQITFSGGGILDCTDANVNCAGETVLIAADQFFSVNCASSGACGSSEFTVQSGCTLRTGFDCDSSRSCSSASLTVYDSDLSRKSIDCNSEDGSQSSCNLMTITLFGTASVMLDCGSEDSFSCTNMVIHVHDTSHFIAASNSIDTPYTVYLYDQGTVDDNGHVFTIITQSPTSSPGSALTNQPSSHPSSNPTSQPSANPSEYPTIRPTSNPSINEGDSGNNIGESSKGENNEEQSSGVVIPVISSVIAVCVFGMCIGGLCCWVRKTKDEESSAFDKIAHSMSISRRKDNRLKNDDTAIKNNNKDLAIVAVIDEEEMKTDTIDTEHNGERDDPPRLKPPKPSVMRVSNDSSPAKSTLAGSHRSVFSVPLVVSKTARTQNGSAYSDRVSASMQSRQPPITRVQRSVKSICEEDEHELMYEDVRTKGIVATPETTAGIDTRIDGERFSTAFSVRSEEEDDSEEDEEDVYGPGAGDFDPTIEGPEMWNMIRQKPGEASPMMSPVKIERKSRVRPPPKRSPKDTGAGEPGRKIGKPPSKPGQRSVQSICEEDEHELMYEKVITHGHTHGPKMDSTLTKTTMSTKSGLV